MSKRIKYTTYSLECIREINQYISINSVTGTSSFIDEILNKIETLEKFPNIGSEIEK